MPRTLILMRHARQSGLGATDHERPLTDQGRDAANRIGHALADRGQLPERGLCSTALRCRQTWEMLLSGAGEHRPIDFAAELYNASAANLLNVLAGADDDTQALLLLAHNPGISMLALGLSGEDPQALDQLNPGFSPGTTATFEIAGSWSNVSAQTAKLIRFEPT